LPERPPLYEKWTATARITIFDQMNPQFLGWGMGGRYRGSSPLGHLWLDQDGSAGTPILAYQRGRPYPEHLSYDVVSAAYPLALPRRACIIGGGGAADILKALQGGATDVEVVELNPTPSTPSRASSARTRATLTIARRACLRG
jgi:hypothetical protein